MSVTHLKKKSEVKFTHYLNFIANIEIIKRGK